MGTKLYQMWREREEEGGRGEREHRPINSAHRICFWLRMYCSIYNRGRLKEDGDRKSMPNSGLLIICINYKWGGWSVESVFEAQHRTHFLIYFLRGPLCELGDSTGFPSPFFMGAIVRLSFWRMGAKLYINLGRYRTDINAPPVCFKFQVPGRLKRHISHFLIPCKN